ncbi:hypothetical protein E4633_11815 [Geomonas terrae]|uniref:Uncharacterized protein n=1 Tax=Geomonas terrae TaxID=2562681 RepID=A0A4S1CCE9_9BACT|nr:hypothetical protein [Geomonas terrae]TGU71031.1 hypothetical protein E4633_11815 [Geomonas terrae]
MKKQKQFYTTTKCNCDMTAREINKDLNDVAQKCAIGHKLLQILNERFNGCMAAFKRWVRATLDKDEKSIVRYMTLAKNQEMLERRGIIRLSEAYEILGIDGNLNDLMALEV